MQYELVQETTRQTPTVVSHGASVRSTMTGAMQPAGLAIVCAPWLSPVTYYAVDIDEALDKPLFDCRKVQVQLTVMGAGDAVLRATEGLKALNDVRVLRLVQEAIAQGGILTQQDLAFLLGTSSQSVADILDGFDEQGQALPCRRENHV
jgi:hypothetical protein